MEKTVEKGENLNIISLICKKKKKTKKKKRIFFVLKKSTRKWSLMYKKKKFLFPQKTNQKQNGDKK